MIKKEVLILTLAALVGFGLHGCGGDGKLNPIGSTNTPITQNPSDEGLISEGNPTSQHGTNLSASPIMPGTDINNSTVLAVSIGHNPEFDHRAKGDLTPQNHDPDENPHETEAISMIITDVTLVSAVVDDEQNPDWTVTIDQNGDVSSATLKTNVEVALVTGATQRQNIFGCGTFDWPDGDAPDLPCSFNSLLQVASIPIQTANAPQFNGVLVKYTKGSINITDNFMGLLSENCATSETPGSCTQVNEVKMPIYLSGTTLDGNNDNLNLNPAQNDFSTLDDYRQAEVGQFFLPLTEPQIFKNAVYKLRIDPFSKFGPVNSAAFSPGLGTDKWQISISGTVSFESAPPPVNGGSIELGTGLIESGTVVQINDPNISVGDQENGSGALPNPESSNYWFTAKSNVVDANGNITTLNDAVGTLGQPILVCTTENCLPSGNDANISVLQPDGSATFCNNTPIINKIACQSRSIDGAFSGTEQVLIGTVVLLTEPGPDPSGLLGFATIAMKTPTSVQILEEAQSGPQPPQ